MNTRRCVDLPPRESVTSCDGLYLAHSLGEAIIHASPEQGETDYLTLLITTMVRRPAALWPSAAGCPVPAEGLIGTERPKPIPNLGLKIRVNYWVHTGRHRPRMLIRHLVSHICRGVAHSLFRKGHCCREAQLTKPSVLENSGGHCLGLTYGRSMRNMKKPSVSLSNPV
jgi:hypothetical protein